jgi:hypothetical protein
MLIIKLAGYMAKVHDDEMSATGAMRKLVTGRLRPKQWMKSDLASPIAGSAASD